jgi:Tfp pilus assembly protein PilX
MKTQTSSAQKGAVLVVALIMLLLITVLAVSSFNMSKGNLQIAGNLQSRQQTASLAHATLEEAISSTAFIQGVFSTNCALDDRPARCTDINGDGVNDVAVRVTQANCVLVQALANDQLTLAQGSPDAGCAVGANPTSFGVSGGGTGQDSLCSTAVWDLTALGRDLLLSTQVDVRQGVELVVMNNDVVTWCP